MLARIRRSFPLSDFQDDIQSAQARLAHILSLAWMILAILSFLAGWAYAGMGDPGNALLQISPVILVGLLTQFLLRTGRLKAANILLILGSWAFVSFITFSGGTASRGTSLILVVILSAGLLSGGRMAVFVTLLTAAYRFLLFSLEQRGLLIPEPDSPLRAFLLVTSSMAISAVVIYLFLDSLGRALLRASESNRELRAIQAELEERIAERTRDLALAAEAGRNLSQLRDLDQLLHESVALIQARFDLYYAQVYLLDESGRSLVLRAGTGVAGRRLAERRHQLPTGSGSINALAAARQEPVVVPDITNSPLFRPNPLLPNTRSEMAVPLIVSGKVVGVLDLQSEHIDGLTEASVPAFTALAGQLAVAIENARLFTELTRAQAEIEVRSRQLVRSGWDEFLDAFERQETIGFTFDGKTVHSQAQVPLQAPAGSAPPPAPIEVGGETVGFIQILPDSTEEWHEEDQAFVEAVAGQIAQQVENLRLLNDAQRYRTAAEEAARRLTREAWQKQLAEADSTMLAFSYDGNRVKAAPEVLKTRPAGKSFPLTIRGETIGELVLQKLDGEDSVASEIAGAVAGRLSAHLENLRLAQQREQALSEAERRSAELALLNRIVADLSSSLDLQENLQVVARELTHLIGVDQCGIALMNEQRSHLTVVADYLGDSGNPSGVGSLIPIAGNLSTQRVLETKQTLVVEDATNNPLTAPVHDLLRVRDIQTVIIIPIVAGHEVIGTVGLDIVGRSHVPSEAELRLAETVVFQVSALIENSRLFTAAQARADELAAINQIAQAVSRRLEPDQVLQTIHRQISAIIDFDAFLVSTYDEANNLVAYPYIFDKGHRYEQAPQPPEPESYSYAVLQSGEPLLVNHTAEQVAALTEKLEVEQLDLTIGHREITPSSIFAPLKVGERVIGTLSLQSYHFNAFTERDLVLLEGIANHVAVALENARLFAQAQQRAQREHMVNTITEKIQRTVTVESALQTAIEELGRALQARQAQVALVPAGMGPEARPENGTPINGRS